MTSEHRQHRRFRVREDAFAVLQTEPVQLLPIYDVSLGGLSVGPTIKTELIPKACKVEILVADCSFFLDNLSCSRVDARPLAGAEGDGQTLLGLKFGNLDHYQLSQLKTFIRTYTVGSMIAPLFLKHHKFPGQFGFPEPAGLPSLQDHSH